MQVEETRLTSISDMLAHIQVSACTRVSKLSLDKYFLMRLILCK